MLGRSLAPLGTVTETAQAINRADDLSRRIPYKGPEDDEIGRLIESFNQTLERLENLFTSQRRLLADVSHELRTPLTVIKGNVDLMRRMKQLDEESLSSIDQEAGRLTRLVGGLLLLAQAESGKLSLDMKPVELDTLVLEVFQEMRILAGGKVKMRMGDIDQALVKGDRDRLKQVLLNLLGNAIQYTPPGGEVIMSLAKIGEQVRIIVRDTGPGIPSEDLPFIFERFYRAEKSRTRAKSSGFGLGLSIAQWIVENHGGQLEVEVEGRGRNDVCHLAAIAGGGGQESGRRYARRSPALYEQRRQKESAGKRPSILSWFRTQFQLLIPSLWLARAHRLLPPAISHSLSLADSAAPLTASAIDAASPVGISNSLCRPVRFTARDHANSAVVAGKGQPGVVLCRGQRPPQIIEPA